MDVFINLQLTENGRLLWPFFGKFHKILAENHCKEIRSGQKPASVTVLKSWIATKDISRWNEDTETEIRLHRKETVKQFSFLKYQKLTKRNIKTTTIFFVFQKNIKRSTSELRQFPAHRNYVKKVHWSDVDYCPIAVTSNKHVKMTWKFVEINVPT